MGDDVSLYWNLFHDQFPDEWRTDTEFVQYLSQLSAYSTEKLQLEPERLAEERRCVLGSTQRLAFNNYQTFIETAHCSRAVFTDFVSVEEHVERLLGRLPGFLEACHQFSSSAQQVNSSRQRASLALSRHAHLLEVLEIPQVVDTCVRNGYYEEALDLCTHVRQMERKHGNIAIVKGIWADVDVSMSLMLSQLLTSLRAAIQLPACLRVVGFLRRMEAFSPSELRLRFLQARDAWLTSVLNGIPRDDPYHHLSRTVEVSRVHLFDILTQYRAIFPDDDSAYHGSTTPTHLDGALFYTWLGSKVSEFLRVLETDLNRGVSGRVDSLLSQCMYFGLSFSRIGADFRPLIAPVFIRVAVNSYRIALRTAKHSFHEAMKQLTLAGLMRGTSLPPPSLIPSLTPPPCLLDYPPLATLTNAVLAALNEVRQCAPVAAGPELARETRRLLDSTVHDVVELHRREGGAVSEEERASFQQLARAVVHHFLPYICKCFSTLFTKSPLTTLSLSTTLHSRPQPHPTPHLPSSSSSSSSQWVELDVAATAAPLRSFCPAVFSELEQLTHDHVSLIGDHVTDSGDHMTGDEDPVADIDPVTDNGDHGDDHVTDNGDHVTVGDDQVTKTVGSSGDHVTKTVGSSGDHVTDSAQTGEASPSPSPPLLPTTAATDTV